MNPEIIYSNYRDEALAQLFSASTYSTFVAMPFQGRFSYNQKAILADVIQKGAAIANGSKDDVLKAFLPPETVQSAPPTANVITEDIVKSILFSTFFLADLTGANPGVLLETGIAMAFKSNTQIILITQEPLMDLHFDIRNNKVIDYNSDDHVNQIRNAFLSAAQSFEKDRKRYVTQVTRSLSTDAIRTLHAYAQWYQDESALNTQPGLWFPDRMPEFFKNAYGAQALNMFQITLLELLEKRMIWTDYSSQVIDNVEQHSWATHATKLGWLLIKHLWPRYTDKYCQRIF